jgi:hypothetical protein
MLVDLGRVDYDFASFGGESRRRCSETCRWTEVVAAELALLSWSRSAVVESVALTWELGPVDVLLSRDLDAIVVTCVSSMVQSDSSCSKSVVISRSFAIGSADLERTVQPWGATVELLDRVVVRT